MHFMEATDSAMENRAYYFYQALASLGYDFFTGVPCSLLSTLYPVLAAANAPYYPATREDLALGLAAGAALAGRRPAVLMQNSGLGVIINALLSLQRMYRLPVLLVITWRGYGPDAPEHIEMGERMLLLFDTLSVPYRLTTDSDAYSPEFHEHPGPVAIVVRPSEFA